MELSLKTILSVALFVSFAGAAIFGAYAMTSSQGHSSACIWILENPNCATAVTPLQHLEYHLGALERLSTAAFQPLPLTSLLLAIFILAIFLRIRPKNAPDSHTQHATRDASETVSVPQAPILRWLSLHEKRDPSFAYAMN